MNKNYLYDEIELPKAFSQEDIAERAEKIKSREAEIRSRKGENSISLSEADVEIVPLNKTKGNFGKRDIYSEILNFDGLELEEFTPEFSTKAPEDHDRVQTNKFDDLDELNFREFEDFDELNFREFFDGNDRLPADSDDTKESMILPVFHRKNNCDRENQVRETKQSSMTAVDFAAEELPLVSKQSRGGSEAERHSVKKPKNSNDAVFDDLFMKGSGFEPKKQSKKKRAVQGAESTLADTLADSKEKISVLLAEFMKAKEHLALVNKQLYIYNRKTGYYEYCGKEEASMRMVGIVPKELHSRISTSDYSQAYSFLRISHELRKEDAFFKYNTPYVNCLNGVYDVENDEMIEKSHKFAFTNCVLANYDPDARCPKWLEYLNYITAGDEEMEELWRVVIGYLLSHYDNAKTGFLIYGIPHTGKSVLCNLIERFYGGKNVSHVDISMFNRPEFVAHTAGKALNVVPDLTNDSLKDVGRFKSLLSHLDKQAAKALYANPIEVESHTKMLFATNHYLSFAPKKASAEDIVAVFNRLMFLPFLNPPLRVGMENKHLADELWAERDGIFTWAMGGLRSYIESGENFPTAARSEELKTNNLARYCPEKAFVAQYIEMADEDSWISTKELRSAYESYCTENGIVRNRKLDILTYVQSHLGVAKEKGRVKDADGEEHNWWHFKGMKLLWEPDEIDEEEDEADEDED